MKDMNEFKIKVGDRVKSETFPGCYVYGIIASIDETQDSHNVEVKITEWDDTAKNGYPPLDYTNIERMAISNDELEKI